MTDAENIKKKIEQINLKSTPEMRNRILSDAARAMEETINASAIKPGVWRIIMNNKITKLAVAAVIIIAALIGINQFGGSIDGTSVAWAHVLENISETGNVTYKEISEIPKYTFNRVKMVNENGIIRSELDHGTVMIMDPVNQVTLWLEPSNKQATRYGVPSTTMKKRSFSYIGWVRKLSQGEAEYVGQEELDEYMTNVFVWEVPFERITVWVDPEFNLPVKVEHKTFANTEKNVVMPQLSLSMGDFGGDNSISASSSIGSGRGSGLGISRDTTRTMYDFQWDAELDESLFSLEPPEGYILEQKYTDNSPVDNNSLIHMLDFWAKMNDGMFPTKEQLSDPEAFKPLIIEEYDKDGDPKEEFEQARDEVTRILKGIYVVQEKKVDGNWGYAGQGVLLGQTDTIICWWFDNETEGYKAIFGDLSIEDVTEDQLPIQP
jgi:hypothetical protein